MILLISVPLYCSVTLSYVVQALDHLDLTLNDSYVSLEKLLDKMEWASFPGVQKLLLKGLTHETTSEPARELLSRSVPLVLVRVNTPTQMLGTLVRTVQMSYWPDNHFIVFVVSIILTLFGMSFVYRCLLCRFPSLFSFVVLIFVYRKG